MLSRVIGMVWILVGILWLVKPEILKKRLKRKMTRSMKRVMFGFILALGVFLMGWAVKMQGLIPKIIGLIGVVITLKSAFLLTSKTSDKVIDWLSNRSIIFFRGCAVLNIMIGILLMLS